ncbi:MAG: hypothetical protein JSV24_06020 [Bacteroidales bacterium]|nr:MAG: hypothetical protein JSV24_06020 [Bacteroidales bacterium]
MKKNIKTNRILEITWLVVAILSLLAGTHKTVREGFGESYLFFIIACIAVLMYFLRRYLRKNETKNVK